MLIASSNVFASKLSEIILATAAGIFFVVVLLTLIKLAKKYPK